MVDDEIALLVLESNNWDLQAAVEKWVEQPKTSVVDADANTSGHQSETTDSRGGDAIPIPTETLQTTTHDDYLGGR